MNIERTLNWLEDIQLESGCGDDLETLLSMISALEKDFIGEGNSEKLRELARYRKSGYEV